MLLQSRVNLSSPFSHVSTLVLIHLYFAFSSLSKVYSQSTGDKDKKHKKRKELNIQNVIDLKASSLFGLRNAVDGEGSESHDESNAMRPLIEESAWEDESKMASSVLID